MKALAQFVLSIGSMNSLDTSMLTQILLLSNDDGDFDPESSELEQRLKLQLEQKSKEAIQGFEIRVGAWTVAVELENEDGTFTYQFVRF